METDIVSMWLQLIHSDARGSLIDYSEHLNSIIIFFVPYHDYMLVNLSDYCTVLVSTIRKIILCQTIMYAAKSCFVGGSSNDLQ